MRFARTCAAIALAACTSNAAVAAAPTARTLGCRDVGIYGDLDDRVVLALPTSLDRRSLAAVVDDANATLVVYEAGWPIQVYPVLAAAAHGTPLGVGGETFSLRDVDATELAPYAGALRVRHLARREVLPGGDRDHDGIPDPLDVLVGGKKLVLNGASYTQDYFRLAYPGGDAPRDKGSCADVVVRALRNAGLDLQVAIAEDLAREPRAYPMVKKPDASIDHRRVRTMLPYFRRHLEAHGVDPADAADPFRPGDVIFMDTLPGKPGPDHVGIVSDVRGESGLPLVINNWTDGYHDAEMDLLGSVPVVARFRLAPRR